MTFCRKILLPSVFLSCFLYQGCFRANLSNDPEAVAALTNRGIENLRAFDFSVAFRDLSRAQPFWAPGSEMEEMGSYALALASWHQTPPDEARIALATGILEKLSQSSNRDLAAQALIDLGRIYEVPDFARDVVDIDRARAYYNQVISGKDFSPEFIYKASLRLAQTYAQELKTESYAAAVEILERVLEQVEHPGWEAVTHKYLGQLHGEYIEDPLKALHHFDLAREKELMPDSRGDQLLWRMAEFAEAANQLARAKELYAEIISEFPRSPFQSTAGDRIESIDRILTQ